MAALSSFSARSEYIETGNKLSCASQASIHPQHKALISLLKFYERQASSETKISNSNKNDTALFAEVYKRLFQMGFLAKDSCVGNSCKSETIAALKNFQKALGLEPSGKLTPDTITELNKPIKNLIEKLKLNISRWEKMEPWPSRCVFINIPSFTLKAFDEHKEKIELPVIVGKISKKTPEIIAKINSVTTNPSWVVPPCIRGKLACKAGRDGYRIVGGALVKAPSENNPLGKIKFSFENKHSIAMHDSPQKNLFNKTYRAFSLGCIRVKEPERVANFVLEGTINKESFSSYIKHRQTKTIKPRAPVPIYISYLTVWIDENGKPTFFKDVYGYG
ncbi:L,D-transpeptidase family protein [Candidatus Hydrogenosomobacter endosymbioticus]|nr:L,D-transpeptidase family protein [Candidatus Hydrogenosomobacter endosymbioticus]